MKVLSLSLSLSLSLNLSYSSTLNTANNRKETDCDKTTVKATPTAIIQNNTRYTLRQQYQ